jgi:signal transduction histidine kinase
MVGIIASRAAAFRLTWIIAALLIPILFLGYFMVSALQRETSLAQREADGAALIHLLIPVFVNAAKDEVVKQDSEALLSKGAAIVVKMGLSSAFENLAEALNTPNPNPVAVMANAHEFINLVTEGSGIILDSEPETHHLAVALGSNIPHTISVFKDVHKIVKYYSMNNADNTDGLAQLLLNIGKLIESNERTVSNIKDANELADDHLLYGKMGDLNSSIKFRVSGLASEIRKSSMHPDNMMASTIFETSKITTPILDEYNALWSNANDRFSSLISQRQSFLAKKMSLLILISFVSTVIGLGMAITMFQSTLKRLDDVEAAKADADHARDEAEDMADRLSGINEEMVRMNQELGSNMQMLKDAQDALVKKGRMEQMGQLTATIAHELRNPLGAVRTSAFLIERKIKDKGMGVESQLMRINNGITRCDNIITQLLDFSRSKQLVTRAADLDQWLAKIVEEEAKQLPAVVAIECLLSLDGCEVPFDPSRLQRAVINLISNASEAMVGNGEDPSRFVVAEPHISISTMIVEGTAVISVKDNGPGISPENLNKIREPLFTTKSFGTGLGLPAVEQIVSQHGGTLEITSELGKGAAFIIRLPLTAIVEEAA